MPRRLLAALLGLLLCLSLAACGDDDPTTASTDDAKAKEEPAADADFPVTIKTPQGEVTLEEAATSIVSLSSTSTEVLFAIGAGDQVVAVDKNSNYPEDAPDGDLDSYEPNIEAIVDKKPDLVVLADDANDIVSQLEAVDIPVLFHDAPTEVDAIYEQIEQLGQATGHVEEAQELAAGMEAELTQLFEETEVEGVTYYHELDNNTFYSQTSNTFLGKLFGELGLENIADEVGGDAEYPQLSAEHIIEKNPDLILLADTKCCGQDAQTVAARPGWSTLTAVTTGGVVELDDDIASRWGPRLVDLVTQVAEAAKKAEKAEKAAAEK